MGVLAIFRYPIKAMLGERLECVAVDSGGVQGDREWVVLDEDSGQRIANKRGPTDPRLRACRAELDDDETLRVTLPDGEIARDDEVEPALSELLHRRVCLERCGPREAGALGKPSAHHDFAPIHLIANGTLERLRTLEPSVDWDVRRFRPNLLLDGGDASSFVEDELIGRTLGGQAGVRLRVGVPTPRCVVPTRAQEELPADPRLLRALVESHRIDLGVIGRQGCVGVYAEVERDGCVAVGECLELGPASVAPEQALHRALTRLRLLG